MPRKTHPRIHREIERLAQLGYRPAEIERYLIGLKASGALFGDVPSRKTIGRIAKAARPPAPTTPGDAWSLKDASADEAALVLPVLAEVIERSQGHIRTLPRDLATWIVRVRRAAPTLPPWDAYELGVEYRRAELGMKGALPMSALDAYLAFRPWEPEGAARWRRALESGSAPVFPPGVFTRLWAEKQKAQEEGQDIKRQEAELLAGLERQRWPRRAQTQAQDTEQEEQE
jgi:hypothetical protein